MDHLTQDQRNVILELFGQDLSISQIAKRLGLLREYVADFVRHRHSLSGIATDAASIPDIVPVNEIPVIERVEV